MASLISLREKIFILKMWIAHNFVLEAPRISIAGTKRVFCIFVRLAYARLLL